jgi:peroxiredoxin Q/BCP
MKAPQFSLQDQHGNTHTLDDYAGKWLVVYFYPKDDTPGCTTEACNFRDGRHVLEAKGVEIIGISKDTVKSHAKFAQKHNLDFTLLADPDHTTIEAFGSWIQKKFMGREYMGINRDTYLINPQGEIVKKYTSVNPIKHFDEIVKDLDELL